MKQVVQPISGGAVRVVDVPRPTIGSTEVLVRTHASVLSAGTERAVTRLARSNLLDKARARPDLVRQVLRKARADGIVAAAQAVRDRLGGDVPLGYSAAGEVVEVGSAVAGITPGMLVATAGGGHANHAEYQAVPGLLCAPVPEPVPATDAAFTTVAAIALHGLRLGGVDAGSRVLVVGLGLIGQLAVRLAIASGAEVFGVDLDPGAVHRARLAGAAADVERAEATDRLVREWSRGRGADVVVVAAASGSPSVMAAVPARCRDRAVVVVVGDVGLELDRRPFYEAELTVRFARSYGPGRYDRSYEDWGVDYPPGQVRWTEGRNLEAVLDLLASDRLAVADLVTHRFPIERAHEAYEVLEDDRSEVVGVLLTYPAAPSPDQPIRLRAATDGDTLGVGLIGAGGFARTVLVPALLAAGFERLVSVSSASGLSAVQLGARRGFEKAVSGAGAVIDDPAVDLVVVATPHDQHAQLTAAALRAGKHVFTEKPLALTEDELADVEAALAESDRVLFVGFNRRWSRPVAMVREHLGAGGGPLVITYRVNAGPLPAGHWLADRRQGGRLLGEVCHFVDTCAAIVGAPPSRVTAIGGGGDGQELATIGDLVVALGWPDGSTGAITYASDGHPATEKERVEVLGRGHTATIVDFRTVVLDGRETAIRPRDKGHQAEMLALREALRTGDRSASDAAIATTRATLHALAALGGGASRAG
ncbi:bi-domain-containing oxidoreductase [Rhabdothermincola sediminis]|uniref:bi-domain-containing oxidoreductase n=1 Tax=Rhabdothermincola sediminis TaxID=2751370 RepID=UPI001AA057EA|nr:bi-domain-containing oxidoreductase [Rhabdothermincola sediminis]